jgi:membrane protein YqaA with SNARE-associated domain
MAHYALAYLINFCFVFGSMALFFAPFAGWFYWRHRVQIREKRPHFNFFMEKFFASTQSNYLVATWAASEAIIWFIIPEFLLFLMIFMKVRHKINLLKYDIIGTVIGTLIGVWWHAPQNVLTKIPYVFDGMVQQTRFWYDAHGIWGLIFQPFSGVPYKVFTNLAADYHFFLPLFLVIAVVARISRYFIAYELTKALYPLLHSFVRRHYAVLFVVGIAIFTGLLMKVSLTYGPGYVVR